MRSVDIEAECVGLPTVRVVVWDLGEDGRLIPASVAHQLETTIPELSDPQLQAACKLLTAAQDAFNGVPPRDREACGNAFDPMESVGRTRFGGAMFGDLLGNLHATSISSRCTLQALEIVRHNLFGHGGQVALALAPAEVDFVYNTCIRCRMINQFNELSTAPAGWPLSRARWVEGPQSPPA